MSSTLRHPAWEFTDFLPLFLVRVRLVSGIEHHLAVCQDGLGVAEMNHGRGQHADAGVAMLLVVPLKELLAEGAAVLDAATLPRSAWMLSWPAGERS